MAKVPGEWGECRARFEGLRTEKSLRRRLIILSLGIHLEISHRSWHARVRARVVGGTVMVARKHYRETALKELRGLCFPIKLLLRTCYARNLLLSNAFEYVYVYVTFYIITIFLIVSIFWCNCSTCANTKSKIFFPFAVICCNEFVVRFFLFSNDILGKQFNLPQHGDNAITTLRTHLIYLISNRCIDTWHHNNGKKTFGPYGLAETFITILLHTQGQSQNF